MQKEEENDDTKIYLMIKYVKHMWMEVLICIIQEEKFVYNDLQTQTYSRY